MIQKQVPIDIEVLCDLIDRLCACLILATRARTRQGVSLHNVTMPKSWILRLFPHLHSFLFKATNLSFLLTWIVRDVMERIYAGDSDGGTVDSYVASAMTILNDYG